MTDDQYRATQDILVQTASTLDLLDLNAFRDRIRSAEALGPTVDPTVARRAGAVVRAADELASAAIRMTAALHNMRSAVDDLQSGDAADLEP